MAIVTQCDLVDAQWVREVLAGLGCIFPAINIDNDPGLATYEANLRGQLPTFSEQLNRTDLVALYNVARLLAASGGVNVP
jgi:hypothetical protein